MPRIERGQFADLLRRYLGMTGESHVGDELAPEVSGILVLEQERLEWEFLKGNKLVGFSNSFGAGAGFPSAARIRNPATSGIVAIVTGWDFSIGGASGTQINLARDFTNADLATQIGVFPIPRETRFTGTGVRLSAIVASLDNTVAAPFGDVFWSIHINQGVGYRWQDGFVLTPGWALTMFTTGNNFPIAGGAAWLEKRLDALEQR